MQMVATPPAYDQSAGRPSGKTQICFGRLLRRDKQGDVTNTVHVGGNTRKFSFHSGIQETLRSTRAPTGSGAGPVRTMCPAAIIARSASAL